MMIPRKFKLVLNVVPLLLSPNSLVYPFQNTGNILIKNILTKMNLLYESTQHFCSDFEIIFEFSHIFSYFPKLVNVRLSVCLQGK